MLGRPQRASARAALHVSRGTASRSLFSLPPVHGLARQPQCCRHPLPVLIVRQPVHLHPILVSLRSCVRMLQQNGIKVLGDAVLNHRCAQHQVQTMG